MGIELRERHGFPFGLVDVIEVSVIPLVDKNKTGSSKSRGLTASLCRLPPIEQRKLDGWGTRLMC